MNEKMLVSARNEILEKLETLFSTKAVEAHLFGSIARGNPDAYSDIDIWFVFKDEDYAEVFVKRFDRYAQLGEIVHLCEPPQNAPIGGIHTALLLKTESVITVVDIYLCPLSTAFITTESKKLFGIDLPKGVAGFNSQKVQVDENYRIDFIIGFIFNTIKKIARKTQNPLDGVLCEYENLYKKYSIAVEPLKSIEHTLDTLKQIKENVFKVSNHKQQKALIEIWDFVKKVI